MTVLELRQDQVASLIAHAVEEAPNECCGLLAGRHGRVERIYPGTNVDHSPYTYVIDPHEQLAAFKDMEAAGLDLNAIYHSHPHQPPFPSETKVSRPYYPADLLLIASFAHPAEH